ncbi:acyl-CoA N-acyltransferase [Xylariales sp. PMI_506]|nr:acyl-CoA N-acyltransferase [Xylariales sp. PMI_506]
MGTPFISVMEPTSLHDYDRSKPADQQPGHIPRVFSDAMAVREAVFVKEQGCPLEYEHDQDDARSCHWVLYASVNRVVQQEEVDPDTGEVVRPRHSETTSLPIGTLRIIPFPHSPHPKPGAWYVDNKPVANPDLPPDAAAAAAAAAAEAEAEEAERATVLVPYYGQDRATTFHDGQEPYVKVGRLAVLREYRGRGIAGQLWSAARQWLAEHPDFFNPSVKELGMAALRAEQASEIPRWKGLVCAHAQKQAMRTWSRWGFTVDEGMGEWFEEGMLHVGMFIRLEVKDLPPRISST